jgi:NAD(P)-dependent dehydrogenase (short-subunit alcohol dehydrogenase family)
MIHAQNNRALFSTKGIKTVSHPSQPVAFITGTSSGIGQATASLLAANGFCVFGASRTPEPDARLPYEVLALDVRSEASVQAAVRALIEQAGRIDVLVNNAGYTQAGAIEENTLADTQAQFDTNFFGILRVTNAVLPLMRRQRQGRLINISSVVGHVAPPYLGVYASSKFALEGLSEAWREELQPFNIHVSLVEPGFVKTNIVDQRPAHPLADYEQRRQIGLAFVRKGIEQGMAPSVVARTILQIATTPRPALRYRVGGTTNLLIMLKRLLPEAAFEQVRRRVFRAEIPGSALS